MPSISTPEMPPRLLLTPAIDFGAVQADQHDIPLVPRKAIVIKNHSGAEVSLADLKAKYVPPCTITAPVIIPVKIETEEARAKRVASVEKPVQEGRPKGTAEKTGQHREEHLKQKRQKEMERSQDLQPESIPTVPDEHTSLASSLPQRRASVDSVIPPSPSSGIVVNNAPSSVSAPCSRKPSGDATLQSTSVASNGCSCRAPPKTSKSSRKRAVEHPPSITVPTNSSVREDSDNAPLHTAVSSSSTLVFASISSPARIPKSTDLPPQLEPSQTLSQNRDTNPTKADIKRRYHQHVQLLTIGQTHQRVMDMHEELQNRHEETMRTFEREKAQMKKLMTVSAELLEQAGLLIEREEENWREEEQEFLGTAHQANEPRDSATEIETPAVEEQVLDRLHHFKERAEERTRKKAEEQNYEAPQTEEDEGEEVEQLEEEEEEEAEQLEEDEGEKTRQPENDEGEKAEQSEEGGGEQDEPLEENDAGMVDGNYTNQDDVSTSTSALAGVRAIQDLKSVKYPKGIRQPSTKLNKYSKPGKFRYNRDFLLQFKSICVEKPEFLFNLDDFGLGPTSYNVALYREQYRPWGEWMCMGSYTPHYTDWGVGPDLAGFQQPDVNMGQWAAYNTPIQLPFGYSGGGYFPHKKRFAKSYGAY